MSLINRKEECVYDCGQIYADFAAQDLYGRCHLECHCDWDEQDCDLEGKYTEVQFMFGDLEIILEEKQLWLSILNQSSFAYLFKGVTPQQYALTFTAPLTSLEMRIAIILLRYPYYKEQYNETLALWGEGWDADSSILCGMALFQRDRLIWNDKLAQDDSYDSGKCRTHLMGPYGGDSDIIPAISERLRSINSDDYALWALFSYTGYQVEKRTNEEILQHMGASKR